MPNEPSKDTSLFPESDGERESSGLQDILAVAAKIKDKPSEPDKGDDGDDGLIMFTAGDASSDASADDDDDALFGSFSGGLAFDVSDDEGLGGTSLVDEVAAGAPSASVATATPSPQPAQEEGNRKPLIAVAVVLGLALVGVGGAFLLEKGDQPDAQQQAQAEMSAPAGDAVVAKAEEPEPEPGASAGAAVEAAPEPEPEEAEAGELDAVGETDGLGAMGEDEGDPMGTREGLLDKKDSGMAKAGKWDQGESAAKPTPDSEPAPEPEAEPDPLPLLEPGGGGNKKVTEDDVDCLLNPDLDKCKGQAEQPKKQQELLAPKVPDKLSSQQLRAGFNGVKPAAKQCGQKNGVPSGTKVKVHVSIEGSSGKVSSVKSLGEHAGTPLGDCVEKAVKNAQFEVFKKPAMGIDYPLIM